MGWFGCDGMGWDGGSLFEDEKKEIEGRSKQTKKERQGEGDRGRGRHYGTNCDEHIPMMKADSRVRSTLRPCNTTRPSRSHLSTSRESGYSDSPHGISTAGTRHVDNVFSGAGSDLSVLQGERDEEGKSGIGEGRHVIMNAILSCQHCRPEPSWIQQLWASIFSTARNEKIMI